MRIRMMVAIGVWLALCSWSVGQCAVRVELSPSSASGQPGAATSPRTLDLNLLADGVVASLQLNLLFPAAQLSVLAQGDRDAQCVADNQAGRVVVQLIGTTAQASRRLCLLTFTIAADAPIGSVATLDLRDGVFLDANGNQAPGRHALVDGSIEVVAPPAPVGPFAYISNQLADTLSVVDLASRSVLTTLAVGDTPFGVAVSPAGDRVYVGNFGSHSVSVIDTAAPRVISQLAVGEYPQALLLDPRGERLYVSHRLSHQLRVIDTRSLATLATLPLAGSPNGLALHPDGQRLYVARSSAGQVSVVAADGSRTLAEIAVADQPGGLALSPDGRRLYVSRYLAGRVSVIDTDSLQPLAEISVGQQPYALTMRPDGAVLAVANQGSHTVSFIDVGSQQLISELAVGQRPSAVAFGPLQAQSVQNTTLRRVVYVVNENSDSLSVIEPDPYRVVTSIGVGDGAAGFGQFIGRLPIERSVRLLTPTADGDSMAAALSASGRYLAFQSRASNLLASKQIEADGSARWQLQSKGPAGDFQVYLLDTQAIQLGTAVGRIGVDSAENPATSPVIEPAISGDGRLAGFVAGSDSMQVLSNDTKEKQARRKQSPGFSIFLRDMLTGQTFDAGLASTAIDGSGSLPAFSFDGGFLIYSGLGLLPPGFPKGEAGQQAYRLPLQWVDGELVLREDLASCDSCSAIGADGMPTGDNVEAESGPPALVAGRWLAWDTAASHAALANVCPQSARALLLRDLSSGRSRRLGLPASNEDCGALGSRTPKFDARGRFLVFESDHGLLATDGNGLTDIYLYDVWQDRLRRISETALGEDADAESSHPVISSDGTVVSFVSRAGNLDPLEAENGRADLFVYHIDSGVLRRLDSTDRGNEIASDSQRPALNHNGTALVFDSAAGNLTDGSSAGLFSLYQRSVPMRVEVVFDSGFD